MADTTSTELPLRVPPKSLIDGEWTSLDGETFAVTDKADDSELVHVPDAKPEDTDAIMEGAWEGFLEWRATPPRERANALRRAHDLVAERAEEIATLMSLEMGKALPDSRGEVAYANGFLLEYAERATRIEGRHAFHETTGGRILTERDPVGPCVFVTPWNFPLAMGTRKIAPALAAGCSVVVKPPHQTPLTMLALAGILLEAGVHPKAVSVVTTTDSKGVTSKLIDHPRTAKLSFTGSTPVGRSLAEQGGRNLLRMSMELGGNAPFVVFDDADVDEALAGAKIAKFRNGGQACTSANRFVVHESVAEEFTKGLVEIANGFVLGPGTAPDTTLGPLVDDNAVDKVRELVDDAVAKGATVAAGGSDKANGRYYPATVLTDVPKDARILKEEVFGPVAPISIFRTEEEGIAMANDTEYGLVAYAFTRDAGRLLRVSRTLEAGMIGINTGLVSNPAAPFGGIKASGFGREGGPEGLDEYLSVRYVAIPDPR
ncbi:Succinate-semialdehyde dehydrogenase [NADP+] [Patulibacter medicamentivorans]|uniref:Succinate-semialdehyde dehydrogenase [NADP+] n=1 Tax=Patulibacter medicamentivorans TaxID=1097667 RepID=H0E0U4_9ACTN|nr:NAD-dependent succinate-semialdehyde dehydrogenase [Patulibacter medicamentivorans]EHN12708.1 Succinate-semialdehyde dehydrogenase [NADP+] [Patulibacter medicamentivorans]